MPSRSKKQHNFMAAVANNPSFAKKVGVPQSVGKEFNNADKGKTFKRGGDMPIKLKEKSLDEMKKDAISSSVAERGYKKGGMPMKMKDGKKVPIFMNKGGMKKMAAGGSASARADGVATKGKTKGTMISMKNGGKMC